MGEDFQQFVDFNTAKRRPSLFFSQPSSHSLLSHKIDGHVKTFGPSSGNRRIVKKGSVNSSTSSRRREGILFLPILSKKTRRDFQGNFKSKALKQIYSPPNFQDGDHKIGSRTALPTLLYGMCRSKRRILSHTNPSGFPKVLKGSSKDGRKDSALSVQSAPLRYQDCPAYIHKDSVRNDCTPKRKRGYHSAIFGRLPSGRRVHTGSPEATKKNPRRHEKSGLDCKPGKVIPYPFQKAKVFRYHPRLRSPKKLSTSRESESLARSFPVPTCPSSDNHQKSHVAAGPFHGRHTCGPMGPDTLPAAAITDFSRMGSLKGRTRRRFSVVTKNYRFPSMVDSVNQSRGGQVMEKGQDGGPDHRCQPLRLGRSFAWANFPRKMGKGRRGRKILELQRTVSGSKNHSSRKGKSERKTHTNPDRQYYGSVLHQQAGGHKMRGPNADNLQPFCLSGRKFSFPFSSPHKRRRKRKSRLSKSTFSSQVRMVVEQTSIQNDCGPLGLPRDRFIRYQEEPSGREVLLTKSTGETLGGRCALSGMELGSSLCVPPSASNSQSPGKDQGGKSKCDSYCPLLAQKGMVHPGPIPADNRAMGTAGQGGFAVAGSNGSPPAKRVTSDGMAFEREILRKKGFSEAVISTLQKSKKPVTYSLYYKVWRAFDRFCTERGYPLEYDIKVLLEFLQRGLDSGLKPATLKVQVSALSAFLNRSLASNPWVIRFIKAAMRLLPTRRSIVPPWDLSLVLNALTREPFEPLQDISMRCLTLKAVFLVAVTTARRVGEISALVHNHPYTQILDDRIILRTDPAFLPKVVSAFHRNEEVVLPSFCSSPSSAGERVFHTLDVRRTLIEYLHRSSQWRKSRSLFVQFAGPQKGSKASKNSIARWIKQAIQLAYSKANMQVPKQLKAHSTRAVSTSWAEFQSASVDQICKAATWSSQSTFFRHYRLDLSDSSSLSFGRKVLQTVVPP